MDTAELVVTGARVRRRRGSYAEAVAVRGDRVVAVGTDDEVRAFVGPGTRVVEAGGALLLPGFQDSHCHAPMAGLQLTQVWLHDVDGKDAYVRLVKEYADSHPEAGWILGGGWSMDDFPGGTPRREDLDTVVPDRPVFLFNRDVHSAWVNSRALEVLGIDADTPDPVDGRIERDPVTGEPSGTLHEGAAYTIDERHLPKPDAAGWDAAVLAGQAHLHALGITGWQDAWVTRDTLDAYVRLAHDGRLTGRVVGSLWWERSQGLEQIDTLRSWRELATPAATPDSGAPGFHPTTVKIMTDGVLETFTGAMLDAYCDGCGGHTDNLGLFYLEPDLLAAAVTELDRLGFQVHLHAIGDRAVRESLDAVETAVRANGPGDRRHHLAHLQVVHPDDVPRFGALGVVANIQAYWAQLEPQMEELTIPFLGPERAAWQYPFASLAAGGAVLAMGSDWAVSTADPLEQIEVAVTRTDPTRRDEPAFLPHERISLDAALDGFTVGTAYVNHDDGGVLDVGRRADLALLDHDPTLQAREGYAPIADASVVLTVSAGRVVHDRLG